MIKYSNRYSDTHEPDDRGRWMREVLYNDLHIGSINMEIFKNGFVKYFLISNFPIDSSINSRYAKAHYSYKEAQDKIEELWNQFKEKIK